jgi:hypothetical protein
MKQFEMTRDMMRAVGGMGMMGRLKMMKALASGGLNNLGMPGGPMLKTRRAAGRRPRTETRKRSGGEAWSVQIACDAMKNVNLLVLRSPDSERAAPLLRVVRHDLHPPRARRRPRALRRTKTSAASSEIYPAKQGDAAAADKTGLGFLGRRSRGDAREAGGVSAAGDRRERVGSHVRGARFRTDERSK